MRFSPRLFALLVFPFICIAQEQQSQVDVKKLGEDSYRLTLKTFKTTNVDEGQSELLPTAESLCIGKSVRYEKYKFKSQERIPGAAPDKGDAPSLELEQEIHCDKATAGTKPPDLVSRQSDVSWQPTASDQQVVERLTSQYFSAKDQGKYQVGYAMLHKANQEITPFDRWSANAREFNEKAGKVLSRKVKKVTWYKDVPGAPLPGFYVAVDFDGAFANLDMYCGYVMWYRESEGLYRLVREEQNYLDKKMRKKIKDSDFYELKAKFKC